MATEYHVNGESGRSVKPGVCRTPGQSVFGILLPLAFVMLHFGFLILYFKPAISTPDAQSYYAQARLIAQGSGTGVDPESPLQYVGPHWNETAGGRYYCTHPPGLPVLLGGAYRVFGADAALLVSPLLASLTLLGLYLLGRSWAGAGWGMCAAALMAVNPVANEHALFGDSHCAVAFLLIWAVVFLDRWSKRSSVRWALTAGLFLGLIPTVRYAEATYLAGAALVVLYRARKDRLLRKSALAGLAALLVPILVLLVRNQIVYGSPLATGYATIGEQSAFGLTYMTRNALPFLQRIIGEGGGVVFGLGVVGIAGLCVRRKGRWRGLLLAALVVPTTVLYMSWYRPADGQSMRFLLPTFFVYAMGAIWLLRELGVRRPLAARVGAVVLLAITVAWGLPQSHRRLGQLRNQNDLLAVVTGAIRERVPQGSVLISYDGVQQHLDFIGEWRLVSLASCGFRGPKPQTVFEQTTDTGAHANPTQGHRPAHAHPPGRRPPPRNRAGKQPDRGSVAPALQAAAANDDAQFAYFSSAMWDWAGDEREVYLLADANLISSIERLLASDERLSVVDTIRLREGGSGQSVGNPAAAAGHSRSPRHTRMFDLPPDAGSMVLVQWIQGAK